MPSLELLLSIHLNIFGQTKGVFTTFAGEVIKKNPQTFGQTYTCKFTNKLRIKVLKHY